jgi:putative ABC transport system permease protein
MKKLNKRALRMINKHKGQYIAISMLIAIGIMMFIAINMAVINLENSVEFYYEKSNRADVFVAVNKVTQSKLKQVKNITGVDSVEGRIVYDTPMNVESSKKATIRMISIPKNKTINKLFYRSGQTMTDYQDCLVLDAFAVARDIKEGSVLPVTIRGKNYNLVVKGVVSSTEYIYMTENEQSIIPDPKTFGVVYVREDFAMNVFSMKGNYNEILVTTKNEEVIKDVKNAIEKKYKRFGISKIYSYDEQLSYKYVEQEIDGGKKQSTTVPFIFLGVASLIMGVMISREVKNDRMSIGIMKSLGYNNIQILTHYSTISVVIGISGAVIGMVTGSLLAGWMTKLYAEGFFNIPYLKLEFYMTSLILGAVLCIVFAALSGVIGAKDIIKITPSESMKAEPPKTGKRNIFENTRAWKRLGFSLKVILRNILRSKRRFVVIAVGVALTYGITIIPIYELEQFDDLFIEQFSVLQKMDYNINFNRLTNENALLELKSLIDPTHIEPKLELPYEVSNLWKKKFVNIVGIVPNSEFYTFKSEVSGEVYKLGESDVFISAGLASVLDVKKNDYIYIKSLLPNRDDVELKITGVIKQSLGSNIYTNIDFMREKLVDGNAISGVLLDSEKDVKHLLNEHKYIGSILETKDMIEIFEEFTGLIYASISVTLLFAGVLGFTIMYNATIMAINERRLEFSSMRILGFTKKEIYRLITGENICITVVGIILGIPLARYFMYVIAVEFSSELFSFGFDVSFLTYVYTTLTVIIFMGISQFATYKKIKNLDFIEALKNRTT